MDRDISQLVKDLTPDTLKTLPLQQCWQVARYLGVSYNNRYIASTVRSIIQNILFSQPSDTVPRLDSHDKTPSEESLSLGVAHLVASFEGLTLGAEAMSRDNVPPDSCNESPLASPGHVGATGGGARPKLRLEGLSPPTPPVPLTPLTL